MFILKKKDVSVKGNKMPAVFKHKIPENTHPLVKFLFAEMTRQEVTVTVLSRKSGVGRASISQWREMVQPDFFSLEACLNALGYDLVTMAKNEKS